MKALSRHFAFSTAVLLAAALGPARPVAAQQDTIIQSPITDQPFVAQTPNEGFQPVPNPDLGKIDEAPKIVAAQVAAKGAMLRALDKISGQVVEFDLLPEQTKQLGYIQVTLGECRYPADNPTGDAAAFVVVRDVGNSQVAFRGWMLASSPALNALDHPRYDVWVLRCKTEAASGNG